MSHNPSTLPANATFPNIWECIKTQNCQLKLQILSWKEEIYTAIKSKAGKGNKRSSSLSYFPEDGLIPI